MAVCKIRLLLCAFLMSVLSAQTSMALEIETANWGFDGRVVWNRIVPLSIVVSNPTDANFEGTITLNKFLGPQRRGSSLQESVFLAPYEQRIVQFYPYVIDSSETWELSWGKNQRFPLPVPNFDISSSIYLVPDDDIGVAGVGLKRFPVSYFPPNVSATDILGAVAVDHMPRWQQPRRQSFIEWVRRGGTVYVFQQQDGEFPTFTQEMSSLNQPFEKFRVGSGLVVRKLKPVTDYTPAELTSMVVGEAASQQLRAKSAQGLADSLQSDRFKDANDAGLYFRILRQITMPDHSWGLIHLLSLLYLGVIFPGCFLIGRKRSDFRIPLASIFGTILVFSLLFGYLGRRGYGEATQVHALTIAHAIGDDTYDVTQWGDVFVTGGGEYTIRHKFPAGIYTSAEAIEEVNGTIENGTDARFRVDIPPFSSRPFLYRGRSTTSPLKLQVQTWSNGEPKSGAPTLNALALKVGESFPSDARRIYAVYGKQFYTMSRVGDELRLQIERGNIASSMRYQTNVGFNRPFIPFQQRNRVPTKELLASSEMPLISRSLGLTDVKSADQFMTPDDRAFIFIYAPMTEAFHLANEDLGQTNGYVLYRFDVAKP